MIGITALLAVIGLATLGIAGLGLAGVNVPAIFGSIFGVVIPVISFFAKFLFFSVTHFWIVFGVIEIIIMGYSMGEREFMTMMHTFLTLNMKAFSFFYDFIRRLFSLVISIVKIIPAILGMGAGA